MSQALSHRFISVAAEAPPGFEYIAEPGRRELRGGLVALWTEDPEQTIARLGPVLERMRGVILCPGAGARERVGPSVWRFEIESGQREGLAGLARACLELCGAQVSAHGELRRVTLDLERERADKQRLVEKVDLETRDLRARLLVRSDWTAAVMTAFVRFVAERVPALEDGALPGGIVEFLTSEPLSLSSASMWRARGRDWERLAHVGEAPLEPPPPGLEAMKYEPDDRTRLFGLRVAGQQAFIGVAHTRAFDTAEHSVLTLSCLQLAAIYRQRELNLALGRVMADKDALIAELSTPLIEVWRDTVCLPIIGSVESQRVEAMTEVLLEAVAARGIRNVIIDFTGLVHVDTHTAAHFSRLISAIGLLGAHCILTGISPAVARTLVVLGVEIAGAQTLRTVAAALAECVALSESWQRDLG